MQHRIGCLFGLLTDLALGLKQAINQGIIPGPRLVVSTRAIVAKGAYGPKGFEPGVEVPLGAEEASGVDDIVRVVRSQVAAGADVVGSEDAAARGFKVSEAVRRQILGCKDLRILDRWLARAVTASSDSEVIAA